MSEINNLKRSVRQNLRNPHKQNKLAVVILDMFTKNIFPPEKPMGND